MSEFIYVCSYTDFDNLAHAPRGTAAKTGLQAFSIDEQGVMEKVDRNNQIPNPAFLRFDPQTNTLYGCSESIEEDGLIIGYKLECNGKMKATSMQTARGTSTCYLTLDNQGRNLLFVNYWDSSLGSLPIANEGELHPVRGFIKPDKVVSRDRSDHLKNRQLEAHAHAIVLDPFEGGNIAYVPDLGRDCIRQYRYDPASGEFMELNEIPSAEGEGPHGPRYIEFHPTMEIAYVVNELSSLISVFRYNREEAQKIWEESPETACTLELIQQISTVPEDYTDYNTCGRVTVHTSGEFVLVSNRGHDSITVYRVDQETGLLETVDTFPTLGETPRHFQLNRSGDILVAANQDTDSVVVFDFDVNTGTLMHNGLKYDIESPNFVCFVNVEE